MSDNTLNLSVLKARARHLKATTGLSYCQALDAVAAERGWANWSVLAKHQPPQSQHDVDGDVLEEVFRLTLASNRASVEKQSPFERMMERAPIERPRRPLSGAWLTYVAAVLACHVGDADDCWRVAMLIADRTMTPPEAVESELAMMVRVVERLGCLRHAPVDTSFWERVPHSGFAYIVVGWLRNLGHGRAGLPDVLSADERRFQFG